MKKNIIIIILLALSHSNTLIQNCFLIYIRHNHALGPNEEEEFAAAPICLDSFLLPM